jgi:signal transduction histidine kinase
MTFNNNYDTGNNARLQQSDSNNKPAEWQWTMDTSFKLSSISSRFVEAVGAQIGTKIVGKTFWEFCDQIEEPNYSWIALHDALKEQRTFNDFVFALYTSGRTNYFAISGQPILNRGIFIGFQGTGRKAGEEIIPQAEFAIAKITNYFSNSNFGFAMFEDEKLTEFNRQFSQLLKIFNINILQGISYKDLMEIMKKNATEIQLINDRTSLTGKFTDTFYFQHKHGQVLQFRIESPIIGKTMLHVEECTGLYKHIRSYNKEIEHQNSDNGIIREKLKKIQQINTRYLSELKNITQNCDYIQHTLDDVIYLTSIGILRSNLEGEITYANSVIAKLFGFVDGNALTGQNIYAILGDDDIRKSTEQSCLNLAVYQPERVISVTNKVTNDVILVQEYIKPDFDHHNHCIGYKTYLLPYGGENIKQKDSFKNELILEENFRSQAMFLQHISHELKTPLNAIIGYAEMVIEEIIGKIEPEEYKEYAKHIHTSAMDLLYMLNDILLITSLQSSAYPLIEDQCDIEEILNIVKTKLQKVINEKSITFIDDFSKNLPRLFCDKKYLTDIFERVYDNAIKFSPDNSTIKTRIKVNHTGEVIISIIDQGCGIAPEDIANITEPFKQSRPCTLIAHEKGIGVGLSIVKALLDVHQGNINIQSTKGAGTIVTLQFPESRSFYSNEEYKEKPLEML